MKNILRGATLVGLVVILVAVSVVSACGGGGTKETSTVTLGWLADQTGSSSQAFKEVMMGVNDYLAEMEATNPIPGVKIKIITYDTRLDYGRFPQGYEWLKGQGMDLLLGYQPETADMMQPDQAEDKIPQYNFGATDTSMDAEWEYSYMYSYALEGRAVMDYLLKEWWPTKGLNRPLKIAQIGNPEYGSLSRYKAGLDWVVAQNPGKIELKQVTGASTQSAWASEVAAIMDCDAIFMTTVGTSSGTFLKEAIQRGYKGQIAAATMSVLGVWNLVTALAPKSSFDGMLIPHFYPLWTDGTPYSDYVSEMLDKYRPSEVASLKSGTTWISAWLMTQILTEAVRVAAESVGPENVDGSALRDALDSMTLEIEGMPNITLAGRGTHHTLQPYCRMIKYNAAEDDWFAINDWFLAPGF